MDLVCDRREFGGLIKASGISGTELARKIGVTPGTIYNYVKGDSFPKSPEVLEVICKLCGIDQSSLNLHTLAALRFSGAFMRHFNNGHGGNSLHLPAVSVESVMELPRADDTIPQYNPSINYPGFPIPDNVGSIIIGQSPQIQKVFSSLERIVNHPDQDSIVLIQGETGTGKELVARALHYNSKRRKAPYVAMNIASSQKTLIDSDLFGYIRGSFTGALVDRKGFFEIADDGTILLDEIGSLDKDMQVKLLRVLQERVFYRIGSTKPVKLKARVIASTKEDLNALTKAGIFREDLFFRINVVNMDLPPLRDRINDVQLLFHYFVDSYNKKYGTNFNLQPTNAGIHTLVTYSFPGNVRELENAVRRAIFNTSDDYVRIEDYLISSIQSNHTSTDQSVAQTHGTNNKRELFLGRVREACTPYYNLAGLRKINFDAIFLAYFDTRASLTLASKSLECTRESLYRRFKSYGFKPSQVREIYNSVVLNNH